MAKNKNSVVLKMLGMGVEASKKKKSRPLPEIIDL